MKLFIRTQASPAIGVGHFMRCLAIAEEARAQGVGVAFLMESLDAPLCRRLDDLGIPLTLMPHPLGSAEDAEAVAALVDGEWLIVDSYQANGDYLTTLHARTKLLVMDDLAQVDPLPCRIVVNAALSAETLPYGRIAPDALRLLGPAYAPIRREFRAVSAVKSTRTTISVMFGGSDPFDMTAKVAMALRVAIPDAGIRLLVGPANPRRQDLLAQAEGDDAFAVFVDPPSVADVLAGSDLVVTAAGGSVNEIAAMGLAALAVIVADNQAIWLTACPFPVIDARQGLPGAFAGQVKGLVDDVETRRAIAEAAHRLIDGEGVERILAAIKSA